MMYQYQGLRVGQNWYFPIEEMVADHYTKPRKHKEFSSGAQDPSLAWIEQWAVEDFLTIDFISQAQLTKSVDVTYGDKQERHQ